MYKRSIIEKKQLSFYESVQLAEAGPMGAPPMPGGDPGGGMPGADPMGGDPMGGGMPPMGGMGGPPPMGGGMGDPMGGGAQQQPIPIKTISAADVWKILKKIAGNPQLQEFFDAISVARNPFPKKVQSQPQTPSLLR